MFSSRCQRNTWTGKVRSSYNFVKFQYIITCLNPLDWPQQIKDLQTFNLQDRISDG